MRHATLKQGKIAFLALPAVLLLAFVAPVAHAQQLQYTWTGMAFSGTDPFYNSSVKAFKQGSTATLSLIVTNFSGQYMNVTGAVAQFDWNANYTAAGVSKTSPIRINQNQQGTVLIQFTVPGATNLVTHDYTITLNYTVIPGQNRQLNQFGTNFAVYSADQAAAMSAMNQLGLPSGFGFGSSLCGVLGTSNFRTARGNALCQQAQQQAMQGMQQYQTGDFASSKTSLQNAVNLWNQALSAESGQGSTDLVATTGTFLLGVGAAIGSIAAIIFVSKKRGPATIPLAK
ncbi:MAG TPA: hypothetical protein VFE98_08820 [Candidatus Bathyarchaeia archaeon]|nr:hypothetical protein [Candidatus Bathyarchaeia archaeon]